MTEVSPKQLEANRTNAKKGGVKTEEGKAVSRYNALKHGLLSRESLLKSEKEEELVGLGKVLRQDLKPKTPLEVLLVDRIVVNVWRLRRAMRIEAEMIQDDLGGGSLNELSDFGGHGQKTLGEAFSFDATNYDTYSKFVRYEASIERGLYRALHELQRVQAQRGGEDVPVPVAVDVSVSREE